MPLHRLQDRLEQQEGRYAVRRQPLGSDRFNRSYWWGLGGNKDALLLQQEVGGAATTLQLLLAAAQDAAASAAAGPSAADMMASAFASSGGRTPGGSVSKAAGAAAGGDGTEADGDAEGAAGRGAGPSAVLAVPLDHAGLLMQQGPEGWALLEQPSQVEALMGACEVRGNREKELKTSLEKVRPRGGEGDTGRGHRTPCVWHRGEGADTFRAWTLNGCTLILDASLMQSSVGHQFHTDQLPSAHCSYACGRVPWEACLPVRACC